MNNTENLNEFISRTMEEDGRQCKRAGNLVIYQNGDGFSWRWFYEKGGRIHYDCYGYSICDMQDYTFSELAPREFKEKFTEEERQFFANEYNRIKCELSGSYRYAEEFDDYFEEYEEEY